MNKFLENVNKWFCTDFVKKGGDFIYMKGSHTERGLVCRILIYWNVLVSDWIRSEQIFG